MRNAFAALLLFAGYLTGCDLNTDELPLPGKNSGTLIFCQCWSEAKAARYATFCARDIPSGFCENAEDMAGACEAMCAVIHMEPIEGGDQHCEECNPYF